MERRRVVATLGAALSLSGCLRLTESESSPTRTATTRRSTDSPTRGQTRSPTDTPAGTPTDSSTASPGDSPTDSPADSPTDSAADSPTEGQSATPTNDGPFTRSWLTSGLEGLIHVSGSTVYFSHEDFVRAVDISSGREEWIFVEHDWTPTDADVADDTYAFGGFGDDRIALQVLSSDGSAVFSRSFDSDSTRLRVAAGGGFVAFASAPGSSVVRVYDRSEASEAYTLEFDRPTRAVEIRGDTLLVGGKLSGYDVATGERRWAVSRMGRATRWPTLTDSHVYAPTSNGVAAINHESGTLLWEHELDRGDTRANPAVSDGTVAIGVKQTVTVVGLDAETGELQWTTELGGVAGFPVETVSGLFVTAATDGKLYALDPATGDVLGETQLPGQPNTQPRTRLASSDDSAVVGLEKKGTVTYTVSEQ